MAPSGAGISSTTMSLLILRADYLKPRRLAASDAVWMTHLAVWLLTIISAIFFGMRLFANHYRKAGFSVEDALLAAAWAFTAFYSTTVSLELALGLGIPATTENGPGSLALIDNVARTFNLVAAAWSKSAAAVMFLKLRNTRMTHNMLFAIVGVVNAFLAGAIMAQWVRCMPVAKAWTDSIEGSCWSRDVQNTIGMSAQALSGTTDIALVIIGLVLVSKKKVKASEKIGIILLAILGIMSSAASALTGFEISMLTDDNFSVSNLRVVLSASIETPIVLIIVCIPRLRLLGRSYIPTPDPTAQPEPTSSRGNSTIRPSQDTTASTLASTLHKDDQSQSPPIRRDPPPRPPRPMSDQRIWTDPTSPSALNYNNYHNINNLIPPSQNIQMTHMQMTENNNNNTSSTENLMPNHAENTAYNGHWNNNFVPPLPPPPPATMLPYPTSATDRTTYGSFSLFYTNRRLSPLEEEEDMNSLLTASPTIPGTPTGGRDASPSSSRYSMGTFIDAYGPRALSVVRRMELIVPVGGGGGGEGGVSSVNSGEGTLSSQRGRVVSDRDESPTLGEYRYWQEPIGDRAAQQSHQMSWSSNEI